MPRTTRVAAPVEEEEEATLSADDTAAPVGEEEEQPKPRRSRSRSRSARKMSGEDFAAQPIAIAAIGTGLNWGVKKALGPENAMSQAEAYGIANGALRIAGRHLLKNVDMGKLSKADGDLKDVGRILKSLGDYMARRMEENAARKQAAMRGARVPTDTAAQVSEDIIAQQQAQQQAAANGRQAPAASEDEAHQAAMAAAVLSMPYMGQEA